MLGTLVVSLLVLGVFWRVTVRNRSLNWVDVGWVSSLSLAAAAAALFGRGDVEQRALVAFGPLLWSLRLGSMLWIQRGLKEGEDGRYQALRRHWGEAQDRNIAILFVFEALLATVLAVPFFMVANHEGPATAWQWAAIALYVAAQAGEWISDRQLHAFKQDPQNRGRTCDRGLWRYSRHPNYFFEWLIWCAFAGLAIPTEGAVFALAAPLSMLLFLTKVTGIPFAEAQALRSRGDDYRRYQERTSSFFPWFPKAERPEGTQAAEIR